MSRTTKKKAPAKTTKKKSSDPDIRSVMGLMQEMMLHNKREVKSSQPTHAYTHPSTSVNEAQPTTYGVNSIVEIREDINMISSGLSGRLTQVEAKVSTISDSVDEIKQLMKERNEKIDKDIQKCIKHTDEAVEDERKAIETAKSFAKEID